MRKGRENPVLEGYLTIFEKGNGLIAPAFQDNRFIGPDGEEFPEGLHILDRGHNLSIYDKKYPGNRLHTLAYDPDQHLRVDGPVHPSIWVRWFIEKYPARLRRITSEPL